MRRTARVAVRALAAVSVLGAGACSGGAGGERASAPTPSPTTATGAIAVGAEATRTSAVELRAGFTYLLTEHVYLAAAAAGSATLASSGELTSPAARASLAALDANAVALSTLIGALYPKGKAPFLVSWRQRDSVLVDYAQATAAHDPGRAQRARRALDGFRATFGQLVGSLAPGLAPTTVADELAPELAAALRVTDAQRAGSAAQFAQLRSAAARMSATAAVLACGMAHDRGLGDADTAAGDLRAGLTALLVADAYSVAVQVVATEAGPAGGSRAAASRRTAAATAEDEVARALAQVVGAGYPSLPGPFLSAWRAQIGDLVGYADAGSRHDIHGQALARGRLDRDRNALGALVHSVVPGLPAATLSDELRPQVAALLVALDDAQQASPDAASALRAAAAHAPATAEVLAGGAAEDHKLH